MLLCRRHGAHIEGRRIRINKTCIRPVMTYAVEARAETASTKQLLRTTGLRTQISIAGYTLMERERNALVTERCDIQDIVRWARQRRRLLKHLDHTLTARRQLKILENEITTSALVKELKNTSNKLELNNLMFSLLVYQVIRNTKLIKRLIDLLK